MTNCERYSTVWIIKKNENNHKDKAEKNNEAIVIFVKLIHIIGFIMV